MTLYKKWASWALVLFVASLVVACGPAGRALGQVGDPTPESPLETPSDPVEEPVGASETELVGTSWNLVEMNGEPVTEQGEATLDFDDAQANGMSFCNGFFTDYELDGSALSFGPIGATMMACEDMAPETAYFAALEEVAAYEMADGNLRLLNADGDAVLVYTSAVHADLEGTTWLLTGYFESGGISSVRLDTEITATLSDGTFQGSAGCNSYTAEATVAGSSIEFAPAIRTEMFCTEPEGVMEQEDAYLNILTEVVSYEIDRDRLTLFDADGMQVLSFIAESE